MNTIAKKTAAIALCLSMIAAFSVMLPGSSVIAKAKKMKMPTKITIYELMDGKWTKQRVFRYTFNKHGDLTKVAYSSPDESPLLISYKYKNRKKVSGVGKTFEATIRYKFNKKGQLVSLKGKDMDSAYTSKFSYNKGGYLTSIAWTDNNGEYMNHKGVDKYVTTYGNDGTVTVVSSGVDKDDHAWIRTRIYNKKGFLTTEDKDGDVSQYSYIMKGKYVASRLETYTDMEGTRQFRVDFTYGKRTAPASKYVKYINSDERTVAGYY